jgi:hypothetical protein
METGDKNDHRCLDWLKNYLVSMYRGVSSYRALNDQIRDELRTRWEEAVMASFNVLFQYFGGRTDGKYQLTRIKDHWAHILRV